MRLVFVNRFYWPDTPATGQLLTDLAEFMARHGHEVHVICSHPNHDNVPTREEHHGVRILRVRSMRLNQSGFMGKAVDLASFFFGALWRLLFTARRDTTVIALTDPPLLGLGAWVVAGIRRARLIHWVQDIYPELAIELAGQSWLRAVRPLRNLAWRRATRCVTLGTQMAEQLAAAGVPPAQRSIIPNWAPLGLEPQPRVSSGTERWGLPKEIFIVAYSGNLGRVHDLEPVLAVANALRDDTSVAFVFVGHGAQRAELEAAAMQRRLSNVSFHAPQPRAALAPSLAAADVHLVTLRPGCERLVFPSKLYGITAVGRPVIFIGPVASEVAEVVRNSGLGVTADRDDITAVVRGIRRLKDSGDTWKECAANAGRFAEAHHFSVAAAQWRRLIEQPATFGPASLSPPLAVP
jgi:glycosyltransferase involved in cell wall biosynthesis